jgi:hypothetical protein
LFFVLLPSRKGDFYKVPISFSSQGDPLIDIEIEKNHYIVAIDSGASSFFDLRSHVLDRIIKKENSGIKKTIDFKGSDYQAQNFTLPGVKIGKSRIFNVPVKEEQVDFLLIGSRLDPTNFKEDLKKEILARDGRLGAATLRAFKCWFFDLPHSSLTCL